MIYHISIKHANIKATKRSGQTMYGFYGGHYDDCHINIDCASSTGTCYGAWSCKDVSNSEINQRNCSTCKINYNSSICCRCTIEIKYIPINRTCNS